MEKTGFFNNSRQVLKTIEGQTLEGLGDIDITKADVDLSNVDNTSDADKPVSTAQQTALDLKINKVSSPTNNDVAKINSDGEIENSNIQVSEVELNTNKTSSFQATPDNIKYPTEKLVKDNLDSKVNTSDVKDNLTSTDVNKPLSANQGKVLQDGKANKINGGTDGNIITTDANGDIQDSGNSIADVKNRANHTGTQYISTVSGLQTELDAKAEKDTDAVTNNVAIFDSNGNPVDGGTNLADLNDGWDGEVNTFADLPLASSNNGKKYIVKTPTGTIILGTKKYAGTYISDGANWNIFGYKQSSVINQLLTGFTAHASVVGISATDSILAGFQKTQKYFNDFLTNFNGANQLVKLDSNGKIPAIDGSQLTNLNTSGLPVGSILPFVGSLSNIPSGFLYCNNGSYSRTTYSALFSVIGTYFGSDNSSTFKVPELRGEVLRGSDNGASRDPDASSRKKLDGSTDTDTSKAGTYQADEVTSHDHHPFFAGGADNNSPALNSSNYAFGTSAVTWNTHYRYEIKATSSVANSGKTSATGGNETRMRNMAVHFLIKY